MKRNARFRSVLLMGLVVCLSLAACAEEASGPQFANDPVPTRPPTETPEIATPVRASPIAAAATPASITDLLATRGAPSRVYTAANNAIWAVTSSGESTRVFAAADSSRIVAIDAAPGGEQVVALLRETSAAEGASDVVIVDGEGTVIKRVTDLTAMRGTPTPAANSAIADAVDWSPQGDSILVSFQNGAILTLPVSEDGAGILVAANGETGSIVSPAWSPTGESVAFIESSDNGRTRALKVLQVSDGAVAEVVDPPDGRFVVDFGWMPNGISLLFTEGGEIGGAVTGIDLWRVSADGEDRELVVSAGTVAPVARIANVQPSPDGRSVAYAVLVPGDPEPRVDSVWIRDLDSRLGFRIPLPSVASIDDITWTDRGLAIAVTTSGAQPGRAQTRALLQVNRDGSIAALWAAPVAMGTPVSGTPMATPGSG